jgi:hypothetical protein
VRCRVAVAFAVVLCGWLVAACGDEREHVDDVRLTKATFIEQGDAVCRRGARQIQALPAEEHGPDGWSDRRIGILEQTLADLRALRAPADVEASFAGALEEFDAGVEAKREAPPLEDGRHPLEPALPFFERGDAPWTPYGFEVCGR